MDKSTTQKVKNFIAKTTEVLEDCSEQERRRYDLLIRRIMELEGNRAIFLDTEKRREPFGVSENANLVEMELIETLSDYFPTESYRIMETKYRMANAFVTGCHMLMCIFRYKTLYTYGVRIVNKDWESLDEETARGIFPEIFARYADWNLIFDKFQDKS